jgi:hypothetical protein
MSYITPAQLAHQRLVTAPTFAATCQRLVHTAASGDYGYGAPTYPAGVSLPCLFDPRVAGDANDVGAVRMVDADLYVAHDATLLPDDRVKITHLYGEAVASPQTFEIVAGPIVDGNVQHAELRLVTDGSDA